MKAPSVGWWLIALLVVLVIRVGSLSLYPLTDTTEARYGEISRVMAASGNWITPQLEPGVPFWAKPPLSFWQGALSVKLFGASEFSVRLPMFLNLLAVLTLVYGFARRLYGERVAAISVFIIITSVVGFITSGAVMTDPAMVLATTLAMISFWFSMENESRRWGYCFFIALSIGFLAKGPIAWVLTGVPIILWLTLHRCWRDMWDKLPIVAGIGIVALLALPWFVLSEMNTPGFLNYFFIGEHFERFLNSGWTGDRYGTAHDRPRGTIWLFTLAAFAPWSIIAIIICLVSVIKMRTRAVVSLFSPAQHYLFLWCIWPLIFFTFAGNILPTYVLPALPAFAILLALSVDKLHKPTWLILPGLLLPLAVAFAGPLGVISKLEHRTQRALVQYAQVEYPTIELAYVGKAPHSGRFYSQGLAKFFPNIAEVRSWARGYESVLVAVPESLKMPKEIDSEYLEWVGHWNAYDLYLMTTPN